MRAPHRRLFAYSPALWAALALACLLSGCWFENTATRLNRKIETGEVTQALSRIEEELADNATDPTFNLLAIKARLALCLERACFTESALPPLLTPLPKLATHVTGPVKLNDKAPALTLTDVLQQAGAAYAAHATQPQAVLAFYANAPRGQKDAAAEVLFQPALTTLRQGQTTTAATSLKALATFKQAELPATYTYMASFLAALLEHQDITTHPALIALRTTTAPRLPNSSAALLPWALTTHHATDKTTPLTLLDNLPALLTNLQLGTLLDTQARNAMAQELVRASHTPQTLAQWQKGSQADTNLTRLRLQQAALELNPNQPELWAGYLPTLVSHTLLTSPSAEQVPGPTLDATQISSATAPKLAALILPAVRRMAGYPAVATPLLTFTGKLELSKPQQVDYQKLSQELILKASAMGDVSSTLLLAQNLPDVAQNNRHTVVPLLVGHIRQNLRDGHYEAATNTATLLTQTLRMDVEFDPLILEEFTDEIARRKIMEQLKATTPDMLLKPQSEATLDLGPLFTFMQQHFASQPKVISAQLTTLIAKAEGIYGQPSAMYRLGAYFPEGTVSPAQQQEWLGAALEQSLLLDTTLSATQLAETSARLAELHPGLNLVPVMETALKRAAQLEDQRTLWQAATPRVKEVLRAIRPEFTQLMTGIDALAAGRLNAAAQALAEITQPLWREEAQPFLEQFHQRLLGLSGIYVPVSGAGTQIAAIILEPQGLSSGGNLTQVSTTFISRGGQVAESEPSAMRTNGMAVHRFTIALPYNFDTATLTLHADTLARTAQGGTFAARFGNVHTLALQGSTTGTPLLTVTLAGGTPTTFLRTLVEPTSPLRPDGAYLIQSGLGQPEAATAYILPKGSLLSFTTKPSPVPPAAGADTIAALIYPLEGSLRHPASAQEILFSGFFDPTTFLSSFTFSYPLPASGQPAQAAVRCQTLAGPIICGAHNLNSARQAYAARVTGMQTRESMASAAALRAEANSRGAERLLTEAATLPPVTILTPPSTSLVSASVPVSVTTAASLTTVTPTAPVSATLPAAAEDTMDPAEAISSTEPAPGAFINNSGSKNASPSVVGPEAEAEPGAFIDLTGRSTPPSPTSPTLP